VSCVEIGSVKLELTVVNESRVTEIIDLAVLDVNYASYVKGMKSSEVGVHLLFKQCNFLCFLVSTDTYFRLQKLILLVFRNCVISE